MKIKNTAQLLLLFIISSILIFLIANNNNNNVVNAKKQRKAALMIVDVQNCFVEGGTLAVNGGLSIIPVINKIRADHEHVLEMVIRSQDWHCPHHASFNTMHMNKPVYTTAELTYTSNGSLCVNSQMNSTHGYDGYEPYGVDCSSVPDTELVKLTQTLWPSHCVQNTTDAQFVDTLVIKDSDHVQLKGHKCDVDAYSAFYDNGHFEKESELVQLMQSRGIDTVFLTGIALDYCVYWSALDASVYTDFKTYVVLDGSVGIGQKEINAAIVDMKSKGVKMIESHEIMDVINSGNRLSQLTMSAWTVLLVVSVVVMASL